MNVDVDRVCANEPDIASKIMDGEAILINLQTGVYYSLRDAGASAWHAICGHRTRDEIVAVVAAAYGVTDGVVRADVTELLAELARERAIRVSDRAGASADAGDEAPLPARAYQKPVLEKFTDMEELLALDPPTPGALDNLMRQPLGGRVD